MSKKNDSKNKNKLFWYLIGIGVSFIFLMMFLSTVLDIGDRLSSISVYLSYAFYIVACLVTYFLVVNPLRIILFSPSLSIVTSENCDTAKARKTYRKVASNIINNNELTDSERFALENYNNYPQLKEGLDLAFNGSIKKNINKIIMKNAKTVMLSTAISQNAKLDMYSVITVNLKMIKEIVEVSGYRPSMKNLSKLSLNVLTTALVAEGLENLNVEDVLPNSTMNTISEIPLIKPLMSSVMQGASNALLTLRIGFVCRKYLYSDGSITKSQIRAESFKEALKMLPQIIAEVIAFFPSKVVKLFTKKPKTEEAL